MANQSASPREAEIARRLLAELNASETVSFITDARGLNAAIDDFVAQHGGYENEVTITYNAAGTRIDLDGPAASQPGAIGAMLRTALAHQRARERSLLEDG